MNELKTTMKMTTLFITHDLGVVAEMCDDVVVMYAGQIVERAPVDALFASPRHPYTRGLLDSLPARGEGQRVKLPTIDGMVPDLFNPPKGCRFFERCHFSHADCKDKAPQLSPEGADDSRLVACHYPLA
jgi:oligopeptide/dipeptide ABC transporter ATP-binding protein